GESAAQGDPEPTFGLARFLQAMLEEALPGVRVEVANAGLTAINSHALVPIARDLARHAPDVAVVYAGDNEVGGPFGPGTVLTGRPPSLALVRASLALGTTRIGQLLGALGRRGKDVPTAWRGVELFLDHQVRADDPAMDLVYRGVASNLAEVLQVFRRQGARVGVSTVGTRRRGFAPLASAPRLGPPLWARRRGRAPLPGGGGARRRRGAGATPRGGPLCVPGGRGDRRRVRRAPVPNRAGRARGEGLAGRARGAGARTRPGHAAL